ncbi:peptidoglycan DD-metalloendopeptidase family protein [Uliginosibacterium gangwonense]|uniref:peptidoglycan DD-metalloendopeptidase family protein n=1 Tax=Uliginosibacterium gangwonense TaxID=392736 RepID=UPI0003AA41AA|nr:peptidoglycan DD-metalloendopeptidase family protein [Uliginosibacterium gangwonense]
MSNVLSMIQRVAMIAGLCALASGCATKGGPAPVESRGPGAAASTVEVPAVARPGYYIVKRGDTLYSIAHQYERDYRDVAAWNNLGDANVIKQGQELRVVPPEGSSTVVSKPLAPPPAIESRPLDGSTSRPISPAGTGTATSVGVTTPPTSAGNKTEPKGGRIAYSAQAWKDLQAGLKPGGTAAASAPAASSAPASKPAQTAGGKPGSASGADDDVDWVWPSTGKVIAGFNDSTNKGLDIAGNIGDPVLAAGAGRVVYVGTGVRGYGNLVIVKHNNSNYISAYAHNSEVFVKEGQTVQKGQKIAALGNSDADRPKLHFEIRRQGSPVDPLKYLPNR